MASGPLTEEQVFGAQPVYDGQGPAPAPPIDAADGPVVGRSATGGVTIQVAPREPVANNPAGQTDQQVFGPQGIQGAAPADTRPTSQSLGFGEGVNTVAKNAMGMLNLPGQLGLTSVADPRNIAALVASLPGRYATNLAQGRLDDAAKTYRPGIAGKIGGEVLASIPLAAEGGPLATGALQGYLTSDSTDPLGKLGDIAKGAIGGKIGDKVFGGLSAVAAPVLRPAAQWAVDNGIRLPMGAMSGGPLKWLETGAAKGTIAGPVIGAAQRQGIEDFNLATSRDALADAGLQLPDGIEAGHPAINKTRQLLSSGYQAVTPHLSLVSDAPLNDAAGAAKAVADTLPGAHAANITSILGQLPKSGEALTGHAVSDLTTHLRQEAADAAGDPDMFTKKYGRAVSDLSSAVEDALERSNPLYAAQLQGLRSGWAKLVRIQRAGRDAVQDGGVFTPKGLLTATRSMDPTVGDNATARGEALLQDWANQGKQVLPDKLPTPGNIWSHLPELAVMYGVGQEAHAPGIIGLGAGEAALAGMYTKPVQNIVRAAMTERPQAIRDLVARLQGLRGVTSDAGAIAAPKLLPSPQAVGTALLPFLPAAMQPQN